MDILPDETPPEKARGILNLRPRKKGQTSPMKGRRLGKNYWNWAKKLGGPETFVKPLKRIFKIYRSFPMTMECAIILKIGLEAMRGDMKAAEMWIDRIYGKVTQQMDISVPSGPLVQILNVAKVIKDGEVIEMRQLDAAPKTLLPPPPTPKTQEPQEPQNEENT